MARTLPKLLSLASAAVELTLAQENWIRNEDAIAGTLARRYGRTWSDARSAADWTRRVGVRDERGAIPRAHIEELAERVSAVANAIQSGKANFASREARIACRIARHLLDREVPNHREGSSAADASCASSTCRLAAFAAPG